MTRRSATAHIGVCGLDEMPDLVERMRPRRLVSLLPALDQPPTPLHLRASDHLRVLVDDVERPASGLASPGRAHVESLLAFLRDTPPGASLVVHCLAGISRSPAAALIALSLGAAGQEREAVALLRRRAPFAAPNRLLVELGDAALGRGGRLLAALDSAGEADRLALPRPFLLPRVL